MRLALRPRRIARRNAVPAVFAGKAAAEGRRANDTARWALDAAGQAAAGVDAEELGHLPTVFASAHGDGEVLARMLHDLAGAQVALSPTTFHNSVFNAPAGYWSIAARAPAASTTLCADEASFAAGMLEAAAQADATGGPVLLVAYDHVFPALSPVVTPARAAFACALRFGAALSARRPGDVAGSARASRVEAARLARRSAACSPKRDIT